jgi:hypothetical protein
MFNACGGDKTTFNDFECMDTPRNLHMVCVCHSGAYFLVDTGIMFFMSPNIKDVLDDIQMYSHHILSVFNFYATLAFMNYTVVFGVIMLFTEISTLFICIRWFMYTHGHGASIFAAVNTVFIFLSFLTCRLGFQIFAVFGYGIPLIMHQLHSKDMTFWEVALLLEMGASITASVGLNAFWMVLIIKQVSRMLMRQGNADEEL